MSVIAKRPMPPFEVVSMTILTIVLVSKLIEREWGDSIDGALIIFFFYAWSVERRSYDALTEALRNASRPTR